MHIRRNHYRLEAAAAADEGEEWEDDGFVDIVAVAQGRKNHSEIKKKKN